VAEALDLQQTGQQEVQEEVRVVQREPAHRARRTKTQRTVRGTVMVVELKGNQAAAAEERAAREETALATTRAAMAVWVSQRGLRGVQQHPQGRTWEERTTTAVAAAADIRMPRREDTEVAARVKAT